MNDFVNEWAFAEDDDHYDDGSAALLAAESYRPPTDEAMTSGAAWNQHVRDNEEVPA